MAVKKKKRKKIQKKLSADERKVQKIKQNHINAARKIFRNTGFDRVRELSEKDIDFGGQKGEFDDVWLYENFLVLIEYTTSKSPEVPDHLKKKRALFSNINSDTKNFLLYLRNFSSIFNNRLSDHYHIDKYVVRIVYCSLNQFDVSLKNKISEPKYLDFPILKYFEKLVTTIKMSTLSELFEFLCVEPNQIAHQGQFYQQQSTVFHGSILPESSSGFPVGHKVVSFYADAASLLDRTYVLRRDGWRGSHSAYQRMLISKKIEAIRKKLKDEKRVFVNNLIATLPSDVHPETPNGQTIDISTLTNTAPVTIRLPLRANSVGVIDGQHRLYSYYETKVDDPKIKKLRHQQNLLVTGIIYPQNTTPSETEKFEANLFLSINSNQTNARTSLRQEIEVFLDPYNPMAIGRQIIRRLSNLGPLTGHIETYFFDKGKLRTSSIVSFGLGPLIKLTGDDYFFRIFTHPEKNSIPERKSEIGLEAYIKFATSKINIFLGAVRGNVEDERWTSDKSIDNRLLTVANVNSFLITLRFLIKNGRKIEFDALKSKLKGINEFNFKNYGSSQYAQMAEAIYETHLQK